MHKRIIAISCFMFLLMFLHTAEAEKFLIPNSSYGKFSVTPAGDDCVVAFTNKVGDKKNLFIAEYCALLRPTDRLDNRPLPIVLASQEFHLFEIPTARGGNACNGSSFWAVVIDKDSVWATTEPFASCTEISRFQVANAGSGFEITYIDPNNISCKVSTGKVKCSKVKAATAIHKSRRTVDGVFHLGGGWTSHRPFISTPNKVDVFIDIDGTCSTSKFNEDDNVKMIADFVIKSDGRTEVTCSSIIKTR